MEATSLDERAVRGDALSQAGDPHGELIALQLALAAAGIDRADDLIDVEVDRDELGRLAAIYRRAQVLIGRHGERLHAALELPANVTATHVRGAFEAIEVRGAADLADVAARTGAPIAELTIHGGAGGVPAIPTLRSLRLGAERCTVAEIARITEGATLRRLALPYGSVDAGPLVELAQLPALRGLAHLDLTGAARLVVPALARALGTLPPTVAVTLAHSNIDDAKLAEILARAPRLCGLDVRANPLSLASLRALVALPALRRLGFDADRAVVNDKRTVGKVVAAATAPLRWLALGGAVNGKGLAAIAASPVAARLRGLDLTSNRPGELDADGVRALASLPELAVLVARADTIDLGFRAIAGEVPALAHFDCGGVWPRGRHAPLAAHFGAAIRPYRERTPGPAGPEVRERRIEVPDMPGCTAAQFAEHLANLRDVSVERGRLLRDPAIAADPIETWLQKLPGKPRYITLRYWAVDEAALAARLDAIALQLADAVHGEDLGVTP